MERIEVRGESVRVVILVLILEAGMPCHSCCLFVAFRFNMYSQFPLFLRFRHESVRS